MMRLLTLVSFAAIVLLPAISTAQQTKIAILPFNGPQGAKVQAEIVKILKKDYEIIPQSAWDSSGRKLFATSHSADDIGAVAKDLDAKVVITGAIKRDPGWILVVTVRHGSTGKPVDKLRYNLKGPAVPPPIFKTLATDISPAIEKAMTSGGTDDKGDKSETPTGDIGQALGEDKEAPLQKKEEPPAAARPEWAPWFEALVGLDLSGRNLGFDEPNQPQFRSTVAAGLRLDLTVFPLAFMARNPGLAMSAVSGIGLGMTLDYILWPDSVPSGQQTADTCGEKQIPCAFATSEYRLEVGLRWRFNLMAKPNKPELLVALEYGVHDFGIEKKRIDKDKTGVITEQDVGPPNVTYSYMTLGLGARLPIVPIVAFIAQFNFHILLDAGEIHSVKEFGAGGGFGLRFHAGFELRPWKGLRARVTGYYEYFGLSFDHTLMKDPLTNEKMTTGGASDHFYGAMLMIGYAF